VKTDELRDAIEAVLAGVESRKSPELSETQFLRELISGFANTGRPGILVSIPGFLRDFGGLGRAHEQFRADLQALIEGRFTAADRKRVYREADRVIMVPHTGDDGVVKHRYLPDGLKAGLAHALRLLLDSSKPQYRSDLKQCQWKDCNRESVQYLPHVRRFFFVSERREAAAAAGKESTGKLPDRYCCEAHMRAAHRARATEATIRRRRELRNLRLKTAARVVAKHK
jgi:hypothetical protein